MTEVRMEVRKGSGMTASMRAWTRAMFRDDRMDASMASGMTKSMPEWTRATPRYGHVGVGMASGMTPSRPELTRSMLGRTLGMGPTSAARRLGRRLRT